MEYLEGHFSPTTGFCLIIDGLMKSRDLVIGEADYRLLDRECRGCFSGVGFRKSRRVLLRPGVCLGQITHMTCKLKQIFVA
jgi:hypothetical protein